MRNPILIKHVGSNLKPIFGVKTGYGTLGFKNNGLSVKLLSACINGCRHDFGPIALTANCCKYPAYMGSARVIAENSCVGKNGVPVFKEEMDAITVNHINVLIRIPLFHYKDGAAGHKNPIQLFGRKFVEVLLNESHRTNISN